MLQSTTPNLHLSEQKKSPYIPSSFQHDSSVLSSIDNRNRSYSMSTSLVNPTPDSKQFSVQDLGSKKSNVQIKLQKHHTKSKSLTIMESPQKPISCGSSPKQPTKHLDAYVMRVKEILDKGSKSLKEKEEPKLRKMSSDVKTEHNKSEVKPIETSRSKSLPKLRAHKDVQIRKPELSTSQFDGVCSPILNLATRGGSIELGHNQHELEAFPLTLSHKPYWQDHSYSEIKEESNMTSSPTSPNKDTKIKINSDQIIKKSQTTVNIKKAKPVNQGSKENKLEHLFPNKKDTSPLQRNHSPNKHDNSSILHENKRHAQPYLQNTHVLSFSKEAERLRDSESPNDKSMSPDIFVREPGSFFLFNPDNKKLEEIQKLYKSKEGDSKAIIDPSQSRAEILKKVRIMDELKFNEKAVAVMVAKGKEIIQPNYMQKRGSMCYTELWGAKEASKVTKKLKSEVKDVNHLDLRHLKRDCESIYRPFKWQKEKSFSMKLPKDDNDPRGALENSLGKYAPGQDNRRTQNHVSVSMVSSAENIGKISLEKTAIMKDLSMCERASKSLASSREGSPISSLRARIAENASKLEAQQKEFFQRKMSLLNEGDADKAKSSEVINTKKKVEIVVEEKVERKARLIPFRKRSNVPAVSQAEKMAKFYSFMKEHPTPETQAPGQQLKKKISQIIASKHS